MSMNLSIYSGLLNLVVYSLKESLKNQFWVMKNPAFETSPISGNG